MNYDKLSEKIIGEWNSNNGKMKKEYNLIKTNNMKKQILSLIFVISSFVGISQNDLMYSSTSNTVPAVLSSTISPITPTINIVLNDSVSLTNMYNWLNYNFGGGAPTLKLIVVQTSSVLINAIFGTNYTWDASLKFNFKADIPGTTQYKLFGTNGVGDLFYFYVTTSLSTGIASLNHNTSSKLSVYPNPTSGQLNISGLDINQKLLTISNVIGDNVIIIETKENKLVSVDVRNLSPGVYFINSGTKSFKFIKE